MSISDQKAVTKRHMLQLLCHFAKPDIFNLFVTKVANEKLLLL